VSLDGLIYDVRKVSYIISFHGYLLSFLKEQLYKHENLIIFASKCTYITYHIITEVVEFDTVDPERVGTEVSFEVYIKNNMMGIVGDKVVWSRIDDGSPGALQGAWLMSGRVRDGETRMRDTNRPRKTMKMLSGTRFQWIAYNIETKQFMGTGGGSYTTVDGTYTENIEFFSRDDTRAGKSLEFDFELIDGKWNHKGFSSKGDAMHEIWEVRVN